MRKFLLVIVLTALLVEVFGVGLANAYTRVRGYYNRNGTYVQPYVRSSPNSLRYDNYGYKGGSPYNRSYYYPSRNYSSRWYRPSWETDSSYWYGRSLLQ